jgi:hypothetical protein
LNETNNESFGNYCSLETKMINSFLDPDKNNPVFLLNDPTTVNDSDGLLQAFNEDKYYIGDYTNEILTTTILENGLGLPSTLSQTEVNTICKSISNDDCISSSYCTLVGDINKNLKCLPGNVRGPYVNYSDVNIDYYYFRNQCYGNCP